MNYSEMYVLWGTPMENRNAWGSLVGKPEGNKQLRRSRYVWKFVKETERESRLSSSGSE